MPRRLDSGARPRRYLVGLAGALGAVLIGATAALAAVSSFSPSSGAVSPGESTTADFTVTPPTVLGVSSTSCISAAVSPNPLQFAVAFDGLGLGTLPANCAVGETDVDMTVTAGQNAAPGNYVVTVTEIELGGELIGTRQWPFTVLAPPTTTTTTSTTTTTRPTTSTSTPTTSSTSGAATTTSTTAPGTTDSSAPGTDDGTSPPTTSGGGLPQQVPLPPVPPGRRLARHRPPGKIPIRVMTTAAGSSSEYLSTRPGPGAAAGAPVHRSETTASCRTSL